MAGSSASLALQYHVRSISLPSRLHPSSTKIETELNKLTNWAISSASTIVPLTADTIRTGLVGLAELYNYVEELVNSPLNQQALLQHQHRILVEEALQVGLLDSCGVAKDLLLMMKEHVQDLQSALRRKVGDLSIGSNISAYICFRKKLIKKDIPKSLRALKQIESKIGSSTRLDENHHLSMVIGMLRKVIAITISVFRAFLLFLSDSNSKAKPSGWSLISKLMLTRSVASERGQKIFNEVGRVDSTLHSLRGCIQSNDAKVDVQMAHRRLQTLDASIESLEAGLDRLFRSHPTTLTIEEKLNQLKTWEASSTPTAETIFQGLSGLEELFKCVDDLYNLPLTQQALSQHQHEKWVNELLDGSVRLLDICGITRDAMSQIKEHVRYLQSALRRRKGDLSIESSIAKYTCFRKKMKKDAKKLISAMKQMDNKIETLPVLDLDHHVSSVIKVLREAGAMSILIFQTVLLFLSVPVSKPKPTRWLLVSKLLHKGAVACEEQEENVNELESVDVALQALCGSDSSGVDRMQIAQKRLEALEASIEVLENGLECMFRRLIKSRASFLNLISH
ncbi:hypothetical protein F0562_006809 [Nyssa sinensis]|uniref:DUF241 domain-containing protein n=1 Tax=Nyssa sinensis TaxID=561372 RepID=A0A5J5AP75_9ASTE|nr:hypothetical protein F0562_006809 [Nyssa sinensis]